MDNNRCRHCHNEIETLAHVLGSCQHGETLRIARHHKVRSSLAQALRETGFTVHEEVHGLSDNGSTRRIDIIAYKDNSLGYIIDPTVRFESSAKQPEEVDQEKKNIYEPTIPFYKMVYNLQHIEVIGLLVGARSRPTILGKFGNFCETFHLPKSLANDIALTTLKSSINILRIHLH